MIEKYGRVIVAECDDDTIIEGFHFNEPYDKAPKIESLEWAIERLTEILNKEKRE